MAPVGLVPQQVRVDFAVVVVGSEAVTEGVGAAVSATEEAFAVGFGGGMAVAEEIAAAMEVDAAASATSPTVLVQVVLRKAPLLVLAAREKADTEAEAGAASMIVTAAAVVVTADEVIKTVTAKAAAAAAADSMTGRDLSRVEGATTTRGANEGIDGRRQRQSSVPSSFRLTKTLSCFVPTAYAWVRRSLSRIEVRHHTRRAADILGRWALLWLSLSSMYRSSISVSSQRIGLHDSLYSRNRVEGAEGLSWVSQMVAYPDLSHGFAAQTIVDH